MVRRSVRISAEIVLGLVLIIGLAAAALTITLSRGPLSLDFLNERVESALQAQFPHLRIKISETLLVWDAREREIDFRVRGVRLLDEAGAHRASVPALAFKLSTAALLDGVLAPTLVDVFGARLTLVRKADGSIDFDGGPAAQASEFDQQRIAEGEGDATTLLRLALADLLSEPDPARPLSYLEELRVLDARVVLHDRRIGRSWRAPYARIELRREVRGLAGDLEFDLELGARATRLSSALHYDAGREVVDVVTRFENLEPSRLAEHFDALGALRKVRVPFRGVVTGSASLEGDINTLAFNVYANSGSLAFEDPSIGPLPVQELSLRGRFSREKGEVSLEALEAVLSESRDEGPRLSAQASVTGLGDMSLDAWDERPLTAQASVKVAGLAVEHLPDFWPEGLGGNGREWVLGNIVAGRAEEATLKVAARFPANDPARLELQDFGGTLAYSGLEVHYLRPVPPITGISGTGQFDDSSLRLAPEVGESGPIVVSGGQIDILNLDQPDGHAIDINFAAEGPLRDGLELLNHPRINLIERLGIDPANASGQAETQVHLAFPLIAALRLDDIEVATQATLSDVGLADAVGDLAASEGQFSLQVDGTAARITGPVALQGVPLELEWLERFEASDQPTRELHAGFARLDTEDRSALGLTTLPYLKGPVAAEAHYRTSGGESSELEIMADLAEAEMSLDLVQWRKASGEPARMHVIVGFEGERPVSLSDLLLEAPGLTVIGQARLDEAGQLAAASLERFEIGATDLAGVEISLQEEEARVTVASGHLDAEPFLAGAEQPEGATEPDQDFAFHVTAPALSGIRTAEGRSLEQAALTLQRGLEGWERFELHARIPDELASSGSAPEDRRVDLVFGPAAAGGGYGLEAASGDAGGLFRAFDFVDTMQGGRLSLTARGPGRLPATPLQGSLDIKDFRMVEAPILAKLLTVASFTGIGDLLSGEGIGFTELIGDFSMEQSVLSSELMRAYGPALGITTEGVVDLDEERMELAGTVVPAYSVNQVLGGIPLVGGLLTGGEGEGLLAATYTLRGPLSDPEVSVNPLAMLTPGFLRGLFSLFDDSDAPAEREEPSPYPEGPTR
jgi:hypothetical protein